MTAVDLIGLALVVLLGPLAGCLVCGALGPGFLKGRTHWAAILGVGSAFVASVLVFQRVRGAGEAGVPVEIELYRWFSAVPDIWFSIGLWVDQLTSLMLLVVTGVALLVVIYSREYMREDGRPVRGYERFFAYLGLFVFSMCALVLGGNFLLLYLGWEAVGLCSYLLIGFYYDRPSAAAAAKKAFLVNRVGDFGFALGILMIYLTFESVDFATVFGLVESGVDAGGHALTSGRMTLIALLLFCGAVGKSAQFPLYVWLPDAMEGPSPVSALIHAATMVTAGVYMVARCGVIFAASPVAMTIVACVGAFTALFAATIALVQFDMKRVLAYSTVSQLGYMFLGLGVYAGSAAVFHLYTHAFFKALLFLGAGSVMHAMGGVIDIRKFSGLRRIMPWTYATMVVGALALAGMPLLSGFWSKDEIIHAAFAHNRLLGVVGLLTALLTAFYTFRMIFLAFHGVTKTPEGVHAHESGWWIRWPLCVLAAGALLAGFVGVYLHGGGFLGIFEPEGVLHRFLEPALPAFAAGEPHAEAAGHLARFGLMYLSGLLAIVGIVLAYVLYVDSPMIANILARTFPRTRAVLQGKFFVDEAYEQWIVRPARSLGYVCYNLDLYFIDGVVWLVSDLPRGLGYLFRVVQQGRLQGYGASMVFGLAILTLIVFWR